MNTMNTTTKMATMKPALKVEVEDRRGRRMPAAISGVWRARPSPEVSLRG